MRYSIHVVWLVPFLGVAALGADDLPSPRKDPSTPPAALPDVPSRPVGADTAELQRMLRELRSQREAMRNERSAPEPAPAPPAATTAGDEEEMARLRKRMQELANGTAGRPGGGAPGQVPLPDVPPVVSPRTDGVLDPVAVAQNYFRAGDYKAALDAYRKVPTRGAGAEERAPTLYMIATCLRKLDKRDEAAKVYREVAGIKDDPFVADCARWQLETLDWRKDMETRLAQLRQHRKGLGAKP